jgi:hypothetical protein
MALVAAQFQSIDETPCKYPDNWPAVLVEIANVDATDELFTVLRHI